MLEPGNVEVCSQIPCLSLEQEAGWYLSPSSMPRIGCGDSKAIACFLGKAMSVVSAIWSRRVRKRSLGCASLWEISFIPLVRYGRSSDLVGHTDDPNSKSNRTGRLPNTAKTRRTHAEPLPYCRLSRVSITGARNTGHDNGVTRMSVTRVRQPSWRNL